MTRIKGKLWNLNSMIEEMKVRPYMLDMGANKIAKRYNTTSDIVREARRIIRKELKSRKPKKQAKILIFDLESAPMSGWIWGLWKQNIYNEQLISDFYLLSWSAKWLFDETIMSDRLTGKEAKKQDDNRIVGTMRDLIDEADIVIAHNIKQFDVPKLNSRMIVNGYGPVSPYQMIDTLLVARKEFGFASNKLDVLAEMFGFGNKIKTTFSLWEQCVSGNDEALIEMEKYNRMDVQLLENVYLKLRPFMRSHPNIGLFIESDSPVCPTCGGENLKSVGYYNTMTGKYETYQCECGALGRKRTSDYDKDKRKHLIVSIAR